MTITIGYQLSSEEHGPNDLARYAQMAEEHGFTFATISDHFHPWTDTRKARVPSRRPDSTTWACTR